MSADRPPVGGHPLRGLRWGLLIGVVAALALFAVVLVVETRQSEPRAKAGAGYESVAPQGGGPVPSGSPAPSAPAGPSGGGPGGGVGGVGPGGAGGTTAPTRPSAPPTAAPTATPTGAILTGAALAPGWETSGWSWDSTVARDPRAPGGTAAYSVTYLKSYAGFALRSGTTTRPPAGAVLRVRVYTDWPAATIGFQVQSADDGGLGPVVQRTVPSKRWVTLTATVSELRPPAGVRRVSVIAQGVPAGTRVWVSEVSLR